MSAVAIVRMYRFVFAGLLAVATVQTMFAEHDAMVLAAIELVAILLFLWRRTELLGAGLLVVLFAFAEVLTAAHGIVHGKLPAKVRGVLELPAKEREKVVVARRKVLAAKAVAKTAVAAKAGKGKH